jgi:hypothetical protein
MKTVLVIAALVFFILASIAGFGELDWRWEGLVAVGLGLWCASTIAPANMPR